MHGAGRRDPVEAVVGSVSGEPWGFHRHLRARHRQRPDGDRQVQRLQRVPPGNEHHRGENEDGEGRHKDAQPAHAPGMAVGGLEAPSRSLRRARSSPIPPPPVPPMSSTRRAAMAPAVLHRRSTDPRITIDARLSSLIYGSTKASAKPARLVSSHAPVSHQLWAKISVSGQPARSSSARVGRKAKQASASAVRFSRASIMSSLSFSA